METEEDTPYNYTNPQSNFSEYLIEFWALASQSPASSLLTTKTQSSPLVFFAKALPFRVLNALIAELLKLSRCTHPIQIVATSLQNVSCIFIPDILIIKLSLG